MTESTFPHAGAQDRTPAGNLELRRVSFIGRALFGAVSIVLFVSVMAWDDLRIPFGPLATTLTAWALFGFHLLVAHRYLGSFDPRLWIPVFMLLFYFGMPVAVEILKPELFTHYDAFDIGRSPPQIERAFATALLTLSALLFGFHIAGVRPTRGPRPTPAAERKRLLGPIATLAMGGLLMMTAGIFIAGPGTIFGSYSTLMRTRQFALEDVRFFGIGLVFAKFGVLALLACHDERRPMSTWVAMGLGGALVLLMMITGARGRMAGFVLAAGFVYSQRIRRIKTLWVVLAFIGAFLIMPMIKEFREHRRIEETTRLDVTELAASTFYEMGNSLVAFAYTIDNIPKVKDYDWGLSIVQALLSAVPNLTLDPGKSFVLDIVEHTPSKWYVSVADPAKFYAHGGGYGYALGAEWYFNFGFPGVLLGMTFVGWGIGRVVNSSRTSATSLIVSAVVLQMLAVLVRNNLGAPFKHASWPLIGLGILIVVWPFGRSRRYPDLSTPSSRSEGGEPGIPRR